MESRTETDDWPDERLTRDDEYWRAVVAETPNPWYPDGEKGDEDE